VGTRVGGKLRVPGRRRFAARLSSTVPLVFALANVGCQGDIVSTRGGTDVPDGSAPALAQEPGDTGGRETGVAHAAPQSQSPCSFIMLDITTDTTYENQRWECEGVPPWRCTLTPENFREDTVIRVDTTVHTIDEYRGTVYLRPVHVYPDSAHIQVVDMQPDSTRHRKELDLIRWRCDGYFPFLSLRLLPDATAPQWVKDGLGFKIDPWGYREPVVTLHGEVPDLPTNGAWMRAAGLTLEDIDPEDGELVVRGKAQLWLRALVRPPWAEGF